MSDWPSVLGQAGAPDLPLLADMPDPRLLGEVTADDVCIRLEAVLRENLPAAARARGLDAVATWQQLPTAQAVSAANLPANAVASPGLSELPVLSHGEHDAVWRVVAAMYDRGKDHRDTQRRARVWAALIRRVVLRHKRLGGLAKTTRWVGEEYALIPEASGARTLSGCTVMFDVHVEDVVDLGPPAPDGTPSPEPAVESTVTALVLREAQPPTARATRSSVTVRPPNSEA